MIRQMVYYYKRGVPSYLIAKKFGVSNNYVRSILRKKGVPIRGHNITNRISADRRTPEENHAITAKASEANRGSIHTLAHREKLARTRERKPTIDPVYERPLVDLCEKSGIRVIPQKAFSKFNVDLYLPDTKLVIELFGGGFHNKKEAVDAFNEKINYLARKKISTMVVWTAKETYDPKAVLERAAKVSGPITIINGDGSDTIRGLKDIILED